MLSRSHVYSGISIAFWHKSGFCHNGSIVTIWGNLLLHKFWALENLIWLMIIILSMIRLLSLSFHTLLLETLIILSIIRLLGLSFHTLLLETLIILSILGLSFPSHLSCPPRPDAGLGPSPGQVIPPSVPAWTVQRDADLWCFMWWTCVRASVHLVSLKVTTPAI